MNIHAHSYHHICSLRCAAIVVLKLPNHHISGQPASETVALDMLKPLSPRTRDETVEGGSPKADARSDSGGFAA